MEKDLRWIKKHYGEKMMHLCRELFPKILETEGLLPNILENHFDKNSNLAKDIIDQGAEGEFCGYVFSFLKENKSKERKVTSLSAEELFSLAGYDLHPECKTEKEIQAFKKYWAEGEELCTFRGGRLTTCRVWFATKKNVEEIKREGFAKPERQDEYGTSAISIQFSKKSATLSIKNRYNHSVSNPDNTFGSDLDNIIEGLSDAFEREFGTASFNQDGEYFELDDYVSVGGKFYHVNYEINGIYYCDNNVIIDDFRVTKLPESKIVVDYFIVDFQNKEIKLYDPNIQDCFCQTLGEIKDIQYKNNVLKISVEGGQDVVLKLNSKNQIISCTNYNIESCGDGFLYYNETLKKLIAPSLKRCGDNFLIWNEILESADVSSMEKCGECAFYSNEKLKELYMPNLKSCGYDTFDSNERLRNQYKALIKEEENELF